MAKIKETNPPKPHKPGFFKRMQGGFSTLTGWENLQNGAADIKTGLQDITRVPRATHKETFEEAVVRLNLTEADITQRKANFLRLTLVTGLMGLFCLFYTLYLLWQGGFLSALLALVVTLLCIATACRYHFWYFQTKNRKLGCTLSEWLNAQVSGEDKK